MAITVLNDALNGDDVSVSDAGIDAIVAAASAEGRSAVADPDRNLVALSIPAAMRAQALSDRVAPDFRLPDLDGTMRSFSDWGGSKRLLLAWSSW